ncbi:MAG: tetratricopeptide repeat protein [Bacteroidia bacterium]|nr:tetratricopeptide repeat protein [Bacteroidia bacterium]
MRANSNKYNWSLMLVLVAAKIVAQKDAQNIYEGNKLYHNGNVSASTSRYAKALELNPSNRKANFNLGNALYRNAQLIKSGKVQMPQGSKVTPDSLSKMVLDQAAQNFAVVANSVSNKDTLHRAWHNIGNCYLQKKDYREAVNAYKKALKFDSKDEETRYNLAFALKNLPKEDKKGGGGQKPQPQNNPNDKKEKQEQQNKMSKEQAEQLLKSMMENEKKLQGKRKQKAENNNHEVEKDW